MSYRYRFILPVWGEKFVERFVRFALPSQLAPGNLPSLPADRCTYHVFTPTRDGRRLRNTASFQRLQRLVPTVLEPIDDVYLGYAYAAMTECHNRGLARGRNEDCAFVFVTPDSLWSDGSFLRMHQLAEAGKRAILLACTRINAEEALAELASEERDRGLCLTGRELVALTVKHVHHSFRAYQWTAGGNRGPGHFRFAVGPDGFLVRATHLHPVLIRPLDSRARLTTNLDGDFVHRSCPDLEQVHLVTDSDEMCAAEFSDADYLQGVYPDTPLSREEHVTFLERNTDAHHRDYLRRRIRIHTAEISPEWQAMEMESDGVVEGLLRDFAERQAIKGPRTADRGNGEKSRPLLGPLARAVLDRPFKLTHVGPLDAAAMKPDGKHGFVVDLAEVGVFSPSDKEFHESAAAGGVSRLILLEDGKPLGPPHQVHDVIRNKGRGRYSHWGTGLHFSTSDNSDPRTNARAYAIMVPQTVASFLRRGWWQVKNRLLSA